MIDKYIVMFKDVQVGEIIYGTNSILELHLDVKYKEH